jgi:hypothetical protein
MENTTLEKKFRVLTLALIFSGALNIGLIAACVFSLWQGKQAGFSVAGLAKGEKKEEAAIQQILSQMAPLSFHELVSFLTNRDPVEEGYLKRDLALAALVSSHHFNLEKALSSLPSQRRIVTLGDEQKIELFPALTDDQFAGIIRFAYEEKWPLTTQGIFRLLTKLPEPRDPTLVQALLVTPEFHAVQVLFQKTDTPQDPALLLQLISEGNWDILDRFSREQQQMLDLSKERRVRLLLGYLSLQSPTAAQLLMKTDFAFASKRLEDRGAMDLIGLLKEKTPEGERLCVELLRSPRSDAVWQAAGACLYRFSGEAIPSPFDLQAAIARFAPAPVPIAAAATTAKEPSPPTPSRPATRVREHVVKDGDSLWKIARQYKVQVADIAQLNELEKDRIYPGMTLRIPQ